MKKKSIDTPLCEITLRRYEKPYNLSKREIVRKLCLSFGLTLMQTQVIYFHFQMYYIDQFLLKQLIYIKAPFERNRLYLIM